MTAALRILRLDDARWQHVGPSSLWSAASLAVGASGLIALNRFGGLVIDAPRSFARLVLIGVWGWVGLGVAIWILSLLVLNRDRPRLESPPYSLLHSLAVAGLAHAPMLVLGFVLFIFAGLFQTLGPGLVVAVFVFGFWFPAMLLMATIHSHSQGVARSIAVVAVPYLVWLLVVGRHLLGQVQHLL